MNNYNAQTKHYNAEISTLSLCCRNYLIKIFFASVKIRDINDKLRRYEDPP